MSARVHRWNEVSLTRSTRARFPPSKSARKVRVPKVQTASPRGVPFPRRETPRGAPSESSQRTGAALSSQGRQRGSTVPPGESPAGFALPARASAITRDTLGANDMATTASARAHSCAPADLRFVPPHDRSPIRRNGQRLFRGRSLMRVVHVTVASPARSHHPLANASSILRQSSMSTDYLSSATSSPPEARSLPFPPRLSAAPPPPPSWQAASPSLP